MNFGTKGCMYNCGDSCTGECIEPMDGETDKKEIYSIPIYENGVETEWSVDGIVGDKRYQQLISMSPEGKLPVMINTTITKIESYEQHR